MVCLKKVRRRRLSIGNAKARETERRRIRCELVTVTPSRISKEEKRATRRRTVVVVVVEREREMDNAAAFASTTKRVQRAACLSCFVFSGKTMSTKKVRRRRVSPIGNSLCIPNRSFVLSPSRRGERSCCSRGKDVTLTLNHFSIRVRVVA